MKGIYQAAIAVVIGLVIADGLLEILNYPDQNTLDKIFGVVLLAIVYRFLWKPSK